MKEESSIKIKRVTQYYREKKNYEPFEIPTLIFDSFHFFPFLSFLKFGIRTKSQFSKFVLFSCGFFFFSCPFEQISANVRAPPPRTQLLLETRTKMIKQVKWNTIKNIIFKKSKISFCFSKFWAFVILMWPSSKFLYLFRNFVLLVHGANSVDPLLSQQMMNG